MLGARAPVNQAVPNTSPKVPAGAFNLLRTCRNHHHINEIKLADIPRLAAALAALIPPEHQAAPAAYVGPLCMQARAQYFATLYWPYMQTRIPELHVCVWEFLRAREYLFDADGCLQDGKPPS